jgi:hypothetical protein
MRIGCPPYGRTPIALQDIEVIANGVQHYDALLGDAA